MKSIKCTNDYSCKIFAEKYEDKPALVIDFNIKKFKYCHQYYGWQDGKFPEDVWESINDKLYLNPENIYDVISALDIFIENGYLAEIYTNKTSRGFSYIDLKDIKGNVISIQESSSAMEGKLWFGCEVNEKMIGKFEDGRYVKFKYPEGDILVEDRLHLNQKCAKELRIGILEEIAQYYSSFKIADLLDKETKTSNNMIKDMWGHLRKDVQKMMFMQICSKGNLDLVKAIYESDNNKFLDDIFCTFEEFGLQMSLQPESKKILSFFKDKMKEKEMNLSNEMENWIRENKLGRKIRIKR